MRDTKPFIMVAMSGGVDSSVCALLLKDQGYHVEGMFMKNWEEDDSNTHCPSDQDVIDAALVCKKLGIKFHKVNFSAQYWNNVFESFLKDYRLGRTPNPDILCNREIKFKAFLDHALSLGADMIATGHYARIKNIDSYYHLLTGLDSKKDQSYFLYTLTQSQLHKSLFPLGEFEKAAVRAIAKEAKLVNHNKKDSTGICFIGKRKFKDFLNQFLSTHAGDITTPEGKILGRHEGLMFYTIGQRQGLGIGGVKNSNQEPWYVIDKDLKNHCLLVAQGYNHSLLYKQGLICSDIHWITDQEPAMPLACHAKIRYRTLPESCVIERITESQLQVIFTEKQRAITAGQSVVFYQNEICLGGGIIDHAINPI